MAEELDRPATDKQVVLINELFDEREPPDELGEQVVSTLREAIEVGSLTTYLATRSITTIMRWPVREGVTPRLPRWMR